MRYCIPSTGRTHRLTIEDDDPFAIIAAFQHHHHITQNQEPTVFLNISHQFRLFPLHYYQLTKTFSMQTEQWSSTRNTELQAKAQPSHIIQHSKRAQQIEAKETEKATPQQETCKHRAKKSKHKQVSQKKFLLSAVTPIGHAVQLQTKRINSPHGSRSPS